MVTDTSEPASRPDAKSGAPVGVFDSGVGGLSVLHELIVALPGEDYLYVADSGHCPYGGQSADAIVQRAEIITRFLIEQGVKLVVIACNAATVAAAEHLRARYHLPFVAMEPAVKPAAAATRSGVVGVLATTLTARGERLKKLIDQHANGVRVLTQPCPGLVEAVESGELESAATRTLLTGYVEPLLSAGADTLVLGCTHYPFLRPLISDIAGPEVTVMDTGAAVARRVESVLRQSDTSSSLGCGRIQCFTSGSADRMAAVVPRLWGTSLPVSALPETCR